MGWGLEGGGKYIYVEEMGWEGRGGGKLRGWVLGVGEEDVREGVISRVGC